jgi:diaminohydroxyphosphoribosylaminopyrimidine deaminase/5-amino-6-(5-phosphoribosylamino)uracil reductase
MLDDEQFMLRCIELARQAEGRTSPNPLVGSIVVDDDGHVIAEGHHTKAGEAHAEVNALNIAGDAASGKTLYVNLEPCCHHGRTPPCSQRVIESGVRRVVCGMRDPNPKVAGGGIRELEAAGIEVRAGVLEAECRYLNRAFLKWINKGTPWLCLKMASTLDGRIADRTGKSRWVTGPQAREFVHELRDRYDCVMVGGTTAIKDDPELTVHERIGGRNPMRVVLDTNLSLKPEARLFTDRSDGSRTVVFAKQDALNAGKRSYPNNTEVVGIASGSTGLNLEHVLTWLGENRMVSVLCEGGSRLAGSLLREGLVDEILWIVAPKLLCDEQSIPAISDDRYVDLSQAIKMETKDISQLGEDVLIHGLLSQP